MSSRKLSNPITSNHNPLLMMKISALIHQNGQLNVPITRQFGWSLAVTWVLGAVRRWNHTILLVLISKCPKAMMAFKSPSSTIVVTPAMMANNLPLCKPKTSCACAITLTIHHLSYLLRLCLCIVGHKCWRGTSKCHFVLSRSFTSLPLVINSRITKFFDYCRSSLHSAGASLAGLKFMADGLNPPFLPKGFESN